MDLDPTLGSSASISQRAARVSRSAVIDLTSGNDDDVVYLSPRGKVSKRNQRKAPAATTNHTELEPTLGSSASISQRAARVSRSAVIDLTSGNDDDVIPLSSRKRKGPQLPPEPTKDVQLTCAICMDMMKEETSTVCGHIFCRPCIVGAIKAQKKCPSCRRKLTNGNIHRIYLSSGNR